MLNRPRPPGEILLPVGDVELAFAVLRAHYLKNGNVEYLIEEVPAVTGHAAELGYVLMDRKGNRIK